MTFKEIVEKTPDIADGYRNGLQALGIYSSKINVSKPRDIGGSVNIDECTASHPKYKTANRWDYAIDYEGKVFFIEVHPADTSQVKIILKKFDWLKNWLSTHATLLNQRKSTERPPYYWLQSGKFAIFPNSPQLRHITQAGLIPIRELNL